MKKTIQEPLQINTPTKAESCIAKEQNAYAKKSNTNSLYIKIIYIIVICIAFSLLGIIFTINNSIRTAIVLKKPNESPIQKMLKEVINEISEENHIKSEADFSCFDEATLLMYISVMDDCEINKITKQQIASHFNDLFYAKDNGKGKVEYIQKDIENLMESCSDKTRMNKLDFAFFGLINNDIIKRSNGFYISQNNPDFEKIEYGNSNLKNAGCGPAALTMAINYVSEKAIVNINDVAQWALKNNMYEENTGTRWSLVRNFPHTVAVNSQELYINDIDTFKACLSEGEVLVVSMKKGSFTDSGHFIVITEIAENTVNVLDPASIYRSLKSWSPEEIFKESNHYFWRLSKA